MEETLPCAACGTELPLNATSCQVCLRPRPVPSAPAPCTAPVLPISSANQWILYGRAYDLLSLKPAANAGLEATVHGAAPGTFTPSAFISDAGGCYSVVLNGPQGASYDIHANGGDYVPAVLYWTDIPYATLPAAERRRMADAARDGDAAAPDLSDDTDEKVVRRDLFLVPRRR